MTSVYAVLVTSLPKMVPEIAASVDQDSSKQMLAILPAQHAQQAKWLLMTEQHV